MECQSCHVRKATVHLTEILENKEKHEVHLCEECANEQQQASGVEIMGLLSSAFAPVAKQAGAAAGNALCPDCGLSYHEFRSRGRLGCPACYDTFRAALEPLLEKIHGGTQHMGKSPDPAGASSHVQERELVALRRRLQAAVKDENYELAARLRDDLRTLEEGSEG
jgi:protein arginine kinase activator